MRRASADSSTAASSKPISHSNVVKPRVLSVGRCRRQSSTENPWRGSSRPLLLLSERQYSTGKGMPGGRGADRPVQELHGHKHRAAIDVHGMDPTERAPVE